ncbi:glycoside hydrolase family 24 protein [Linderina pennispora]|uniref:Glycoside hydrolase family 24 protein n=1 Tax=Linderina pennispora TaxID=61395 RepID=A0A1Y1WN14_9FUNG|nr:glycoside hydrolase family 24 protein [Linderina pennispora]ORX74698.1 glycoside hydrolase family 24 protein [Linderina pennispora]
MKFIAIASAFLASIVLTSAYPIQKASVINCRSSPSTSGKVVKTYKLNQDIKISCQATGIDVKGNTIWDRTMDGCYVSDYYVKTGKNGFVAKKCSGGDSKPNPKPTGTYCKGINARATKLIKSFESFVPQPSPDPSGFQTVGYGHKCQQEGCKEVKYKFPLTQATASALMSQDVAVHTACLAKLLKSNVKLNDNQWGALTSWVFNIGCGNLASSELTGRLNKGENPNKVIDSVFPNWRSSKGKILPGLKRRRDEEMRLAKVPSKKQAFPSCK